MTPREFRNLFAEFRAPSWAAWGSIEDAIFGQKPADPDLVRRVTGRAVLPSKPVAEFWAAAGRGSGKSRFIARLATFFACARRYRRVPGEFIYVGVFAPDRRQAKVTFRYVVGLLRSVPALAKLIVREQDESIELSVGVIIEVITASKAAPRGRAYALAIVEEAAYLPVEDRTDPDRELLRALRPALARVPGSLLAVVSSPYARRGELYRTWRAKFGKDDDPSVLYVQSDTATLNPSFSRQEIARAYAEDPEAARAEYGGEFRQDIESFISQAAIDRCTIEGRLELPPMPTITYRAFLDPSGGSQDSFTLAISHAEQRGEQRVTVLDCVREIKAPFSPAAAVAELAPVLASYHCLFPESDRYAGQWPTEAFAKHQITVRPSEKTKSDLYLAALPALNSRTVELLDLPRLRAQLSNLERRTARGGRDSIDHAPGSHDDVANAVCGALVLAGSAAMKPISAEEIAGVAALNASLTGPSRWSGAVGSDPFGGSFGGSTRHPALSDDQGRGAGW